MSVSIKLLAHASVLIKTKSQTIYIDPTTKGTELKEKDFSPADLILVTHGHQDHFDKKLLRKIRKMGSPIIAPENLKKEIDGIVWGMRAGERMEISNGIVVWAVPAYNDKRFRESGEPYHPLGYGVGYVLQVNGKKIYHAGDTDLISEMDNLPELDVALLPVGGTYTMDVTEATEAALIIRPKVVLPMHVRDSNPVSLKATVEAESDTKVVMLERGQSFTMK